MPERAVYFLEAALPADLPGVSPRTPGTPFPFWGTYALFDFAFASLRGLARESCSLVCDSRDRQAVVQATSRWGRNAVRVRDAENGLDELRRLAASERARSIVVSSLSYAAYIDPRELEGALVGALPRRVRVDSSPMPLYLLPREALLEALEQAARRDPDEGGSLRGFLYGYLPSIVREHADLNGRVFFLDSAMQIWDAHHYLRDNLGMGRASLYLDALAGAQQPTAEAHIGADGSVKDSLVASGALVEGSVTDCVLFPGVVVRPGAVVRQCVIMTGNRIGAGATVANTLILPYQQELNGEADTVGEGAEIGDTRNVMNTRNDDFPRQIARGLTLIGMNASVPPNMNVGTGCYIGPGSGNVLRGMKKLARGASVR